MSTSRQQLVISQGGWGRTGSPGTWLTLALGLVCLAGPLVEAAEVPAAEPSSSASTAETNAVNFFKEHFFPYEPFYFIAGADSPNAKFQLSFRYRICSSDQGLGRSVPALRGVNFAYTQVSLWDWVKPSAPFLDSSYKPELHYLMENLDRGKWGDWLRLDVCGGVQHESNGRDGPSSRSLNLIYLRPTLTLGRPGGFQATLSPRACYYLAGLDDNPDLPRYRGYVDLRATLGWENCLRLAATGRVGERGNRGSLQLDLTYPLSRVSKGAIGVYLHLQFFTGYGESFLLYNERSSAFRAGFALFR